MAESEAASWRRITQAFVSLRCGVLYFFGGIIMPPIFSQVPFSTYFQSPGSLSLVAVPAHECEPVALAQSFAPALATPKHLSFEASGATGPAWAARWRRAPGPRRGQSG